MKNKNTIDKYIASKVKNTNSIRLIYKKAGRSPKVQIIDNVLNLKKAIIKKQLDIIPYENIYMICHNKKSMNTMTLNVVLTFKNIKGDLILIDIDKNSREFKSLSQEDIIWYSQDLINKCPINSSKKINRISTKKVTEIYERGFNDNITSTNFEKTLINVLINIELVLANILKNNGDKRNG